MAIKLVNALRNLHIEDNEIEIQKTISFLINNRGYKESQIDATLVIRDYDYIELSEYYGHYEIRPALECMPSCGSPHALDEAYESILNRVIPNREPPQHTRYSAAAKKFMPTEENNEQIENATTNQRSEPLIEETSNKIDNVFISENYKLRKGWIYTDKATSEDKERFKDHIEYLCKNNGSARIIKDYIKSQEKEDILVPIQPTKQYDLLEEIGVKFKKKTFLNK